MEIELDVTGLLELKPHIFRTKFVKIGHSDTRDFRRRTLSYYRRGGGGACTIG